MNSFKTFMNKVSDRVRDVTLDAGVVDGQLTLQQDEDSVEGFVCPTCFNSYNTPELLQEHYQRIHVEPAANYLCPECSVRLASQEQLEKHYMEEHPRTDPESEVTVESLKEQLKEAHISLKEERWHSEDLRKELESLQKSMALDTNDTNEQVIPQSQYDALVNSKAELNSEALALRKQLSEALEHCSALRHQLTLTSDRAEQAETLRATLETRASEYAVEKAELRAQLDMLTAEKMSLETAVEEERKLLCAGNTAEAAEIERLTAELSRMKTVMNEKEKQVEALQQREVNLNQDLKSKSEAVAEQKQEIRGLKDEVDGLKKKLQNCSTEFSRVSEDLKVRSAEVVTLSASVLEHKTSAGGYEDTITRLSQQVCDLQTTLSTLQDTEVQLKERCEALNKTNSTLQETNGDLERRISEKEVEVCRLQELLGDANKEEAEVVARKTEQVEQLREQVLALQDSVRVVEKISDEKSSELKATATKLSAAESTAATLHTKLTQAQEKSSEQTLKIRELSERVEQLEKVEKDLEASEAKSARDNQRLTALEQELEQARRDGAEKEKEREDLKSGLAAVEADKNVLAARTVALKEDLENKDAVIAVLQTNVQQEMESRNYLNNQFDELQKAETSLRKEFAELSEKMILSEKKALESETNLIELRDILSNKEKDLASLQEQLAATKEELVTTQRTQSKRLELSEKNCAGLSEQLELNVLQMTELKNKQADLSDKLKGVEEEKARALEKLRATSELLEDSQAKVDSLTASLETATAESASLKNKNCTLQEEVELLLKQVNEASDSATERVLQHAAEIEELQRLVNHSESTLHELQKKFNFERDELKNKLSVCETRASEEQSRAEEAEVNIATFEAQLAEVQGDKLELEVRIECMEKEQKTLVERCVGAEGEVDAHKQTITQLRRKLDDSTAALHELGRQNQALQLETNKLSGRKWTEDEEVKNCTTCNKGFTMTVRRHHCRNCGQIFCGECSSQTAPLEANKKPVRVCDNCHNELVTKHGLR